MSKVIHCIAYTAKVHVQNYCNWPLRGLQFNCPFPRFIHNKGVLTVVLLFDFISYLPVPIYFYCVYARIQHLNLRTYWGRGGVGGGGGIHEDKTSVPDFFSSCSFNPRAHFKTNLVIVSCYGYEI